jgi:hypothetical protein
MSGARNPLNWPETSLVLFAFLLHFVWELLQLPLFTVVTELSAWQAIVHCTRATFGDVIIAYVAFLGASIWARSRYWIVGPHAAPAIIFIVIGLLITVAFEYLATGPLNRWTYADSMPLVPGLQVGAAPVLQWLILPVILLWIMRRRPPPPLKPASLIFAQVEAPFPGRCRHGPRATSCRIEEAAQSR